MTVEQKIKSLKAKRANLLKQAKQETKKLEEEFKAAQLSNEKPLTEYIKSWTGRYYAKVGPIHKEAKLIQDAIDLLGRV